jgi:predicted Fe-Mo cluster-binding NifX family protein
MKRIAFACETNLGLQAEMSAHFGRCPYYAIVDIDGRLTCSMALALMWLPAWAA